MKALRLLLCLAVAACADLDTKPWFRVDGSAASAEQLDLDKTTCRQEMKKSVEATTQAAVLDRNIIRSDVYEACMARLGYSNQGPAVPAVVQGSPPPPVAQGSPPPPVAQGRPAPPIAQGRPTPPVAQGGAAVVQGASPTVASTPPPRPPPPAQDCRTPTDLRMWLPLCP